MTVEDLIECKKNPVSFFRHLHRGARHSRRGPKNPWLHQEHILNLATTGQDLFISKPRQVGLSSSLMMYALWFAFSKPNKTVVFVNFKGVGLFKEETIKSLLDDSDPVLRAVSSEVSSLKDGHISFRNGSRVFSMPARDGTCHLPASDLVICDEFDYFFDPHSTFLSIWPALVASKGQLIICSSPNSSPRDSFFEECVLNSKLPGKSVRIFYSKDRFCSMPTYLSTGELGFFNGEEDIRSLMYKNWLPIGKYATICSDQVYLF